MNFPYRKSWKTVHFRHIVCMKAMKALTRLGRYTSLVGPLLMAYAISTKIPWTSPNIELTFFNIGQEMPLNPSLHFSKLY